METPVVETRRLEVPLCRTGHYVTRRLDVHLPAVQAQALRDLFDGLVASGQKLASGKPVDAPQKALLWLLEGLVLQKP